MRFPLIFAIYKWSVIAPDLVTSTVVSGCRLSRCPASARRASALVREGRPKVRISRRDNLALQCVGQAIVTRPATAM
jgi:hypothetical protein